MARQKQDRKQDTQQMTPLYDDFIYDDPDEVKDENQDESNASDTPERALSELERSRALEDDSDGDDEEEGGGLVRALKKKKKSARKKSERPRERKELPSRLRKALIGLVTLVIFAFLAVMVIARVMPESVLLQQPESFLARVITPVQSAFSSVTEGLAGYFRTLKLRSNLETEYNKLRSENEQLVYQAMLADELQEKLSQYENMYDEMSANENMNPIACTVIGRGDSNYFSTFTINRGSRDGIEDYMAVTISGALVGYTENVSESKSDVRSIIDTEASIAALIQSSRDQGTIRGTLGADGTAMCRMYYLPDDHLPRPGDTVVTSGVGMSFPKGIPIGTVRESTRGMDANKQYIVVEPTVDFEHIEYVIVLRYKPTAEAVEGRDASASDIEFVPLATARPYPTLRIGSTSLFGTPTPEPGATATPEPTVTPTPSPTPRPTFTPAPTINGPVYEYNPVSGEATATPTASPTPSPTPYVTLNPGDMTYEED